jgi:hypothetical protein
MLCNNACWHFFFNYPVGRGKTHSKPLGLFNAKHFVFLLKIRQKEKPE